MRRALTLIVAVALLTLPVATAHSERSQRGNLRAALQGEVSPLKLPRQRPAPVSLRLSGSLETTDGSDLPPLTAMRFAFAGRSAVQPRGLPVCPRARLRNTRDREALAACGGSLVGQGRIEVQARIPSQP